MKKIKARSIFISDIHLGSKHCQAHKLLEFLKNVECEYLYLVGDILDVWSMKSRGIAWTSDQNKVVSKIFKMSKDTKVFYILGNHDEIFRQHAPIPLGSILVTKDHTHTTLRGKKLLVTHGDMFDPIICNHKWLSKIGGRVYEWLISFNRVFNKARRLFGLPYWSLSKHLKYRAKSVTKILDNFETVLVEHAKERGYHGVVAGHIHTPDCNHKTGYYNCGDWVESCTALIEDYGGNLSIFFME